MNVLNVLQSNKILIQISFLLLAANIRGKLDVDSSIYLCFLSTVVFSNLQRESRLWVWKINCSAFYIIYFLSNFLLTILLTSYYGFTAVLQQRKLQKAELKKLVVISSSFLELDYANSDKSLHFPYVDLCSKIFNTTFLKGHGKIKTSFSTTTFCTLQFSLFLLTN